MDRAELAGRIDHTVLGPTTTPADVDRVLRDAQRYGMNACVPPCYVTRAADTESDVTLATVIGFPQGQHTPETKRSEAVEAVSDGAEELDVVMNVGRLTASERDRVREDLEDVVEAVSVPVKVIVESPLLSEAELRTASEIGVEAGADFLKTSTGFVEGGATVEDVEVMAEYLPVKASGGIGSYAEATAMFEAGAERIGASSGTAIVDGFDGEN